MFATRSMRLETEIVKWVALAVLAMTLALLAASLAKGTDLPREPQRLPDAMAEAAVPMPTMEVLPVDPNIQLWMILAAHRQGEAQTALDGWETFALPPETEVWRHVARGMALLQVGEVERAASALGLAEDLQADNPVVHYALGILRLEQAREARDWYDAVGPAVVRLAAYRPREIVPNSKSMYELAAMTEFEAALANADNLERTLILVMPDYRAPATVPTVTVGDLLAALQAERFEAQSHNMLGAMNIDRGNAATAEKHLDAAVGKGANVVFGYRDLGALYEQEGRHGDAFRVYLKSVGHDPALIRPLQKALENAGKVLFPR